MHQGTQRRNQEGFSLVELIVAMGIMLVVMGAVFALVRDSIKIATTTYELTDAQENLRTAQEIINRDIMYAGDGLKSISTIRAPLAFATSYVTLTPVVVSPGIVNLGILTSDNNVPAATAVPLANPAATVRTTTDRQTIMEIDASFVPVSPLAIDATGGTITLPVGYAMGNFTQGEIYFLTSTVGGTFFTITNINAGNRQLFAATGAPGDPYGLNLTGASGTGHVSTISNAGVLATSLMRMRMIHYYVNSNGLLMRRVFGVPGRGFRESIIAEHVVNVQFNYSLITVDGAGNVTPSTTANLTTSGQQLAVRHVEVKVTVETPHALQDGVRSQLSTTTSTSVRNMQFRQAL